MLIYVHFIYVIIMETIYFSNYLHLDWLNFYVYVKMDDY